MSGLHHKTPGSRPSVLFIISVITLTILIESHASLEEHDHDFNDNVNEGNHEAHTSRDLPKDKVLLRTVETLTFTRHKRTTSRRTHSIHQLSCVGGSAGCKLFTPNLVECRNGGVDKSTGKQQWTCHAEMSERVKFSHVEVICEGYDYPEDDYILLGSCGLEFTLDYVNPHDYHDKSYFKHMDDHEKDMHHKRVRAQHGRDQPEPQLWLLRTLSSITSNLVGGSYILISVILTLVILATVVRYFAATSNRRNRPILAAAGGGRGRGYGPLSSPVTEATKKAC